MARFLHALLLAIAAFSLSGCDTSDGERLRVGVIDGSESPFAEPLAGTTLASLLVRDAVAGGLVRFEDDGSIAPGLAERWIATSDGLSYIFRLRDARWRTVADAERRDPAAPEADAADGEPVVAQQVARLLARAIAAQRRGPLGPELALVRDVRALTDRVVEVRLEAPQPALLALLARPELAVAQRGRVAGAMMLQVVDDQAVLAMAGGGESRPLIVSALAAREAVARFGRGEIDMVLGGTIIDLPDANATGIARGTLQLDPVGGLFGLMVVEAEGFLSEPANREAMAMAIDREALFAPFNIAGFPVTTLLVPEEAEDYGRTTGRRWTDADLAGRRSIARGRVAQWEGERDPVPPLRLAMPDGSGADILFAGLARDFAAIGLELRRVQWREDADLRLVDRVAPIGRANWYLGQLGCNFARICDESADFLLADARMASNADFQRQRLAEADVALTALNSFIPLGGPLRWSLVRGDVTGFAANPLGWHPLPPLARLPN